MPVEIIGEFGTPGASRAWISAQATLAIRFIIKKCPARECAIADAISQPERILEKIDER